MPRWVSTGEASGAPITFLFRIELNPNNYYLLTSETGGKKAFTSPPERTIIGHKSLSLSA